MPSRIIPTNSIRVILAYWLKCTCSCQSRVPEGGWSDEEVLAAIIRITGGNFRLLHRLLTQIARLVKINALPKVTSQAVETARESLVIGTA